MTKQEYLTKLEKGYCPYCNDLLAFIDDESVSYCENKYTFKVYNECPTCEKRYKWFETYVRVAGIEDVEEINP